MYVQIYYIIVYSQSNQGTICMSYACAKSPSWKVLREVFGVFLLPVHTRLDMKVVVVLLAVVVCALSDEPNVYFKETFEDGGKLKLY